MTPSELRELADALAKGTHFVDSPELHAAMQNAADYLRACAEERPDGWRLVPAEPTEAMKSAGGHVNSEWLNDDAPLYESRYAMPMDGVWSAMLAAAPAAPQAEPCIGNDPACPCQDGDPCHYRDTETTKAWPIPQVDQKREPWSGYEAGHRAGYALALTERRTDDCTFETDTPDEHTHIEEVRALLRGDTGLKEQAKPPRQAGQEISLGALMREQRQSRIVAGAYPDGNPNAGAMMAQTPQAGPQREPLSDDDINKLAWKQNLWTDGMIEFSFVALAREVERAHGIGGSDD